MLSIGVVNQKGGSGKTLLTRNLAAVLARTHKTLLIDCDPQSSLTYAAGLQTMPDLGLSDVLAHQSSIKLKDVIVSVGDNLDIVPSGKNLAAVELNLASRMGRENALKRAIATLPSLYDLALIDSLPSVNVLMANILAASQALIIPVQPDVVALRALTQFLDVVAEAKDSINPDLKIAGIVFTFYAATFSHHNDAIRLIEHMGQPTFKTRIGRSVKVSEAAISGTSVVDYDPTNPRSDEFIALAKEVTTWLKNQR